MNITESKCRNLDSLHKSNFYSMQLCSSDRGLGRTACIYDLAKNVNLFNLVKNFVFLLLLLNPISSSCKKIIKTFFSSSEFNTLRVESGERQADILEFYAPLYIPFPELSRLHVRAEKNNFAIFFVLPTGFYVRLCICLARKKCLNKPANEQKVIKLNVERA